MKKLLLILFVMATPIYAGDSSQKPYEVVRAEADEDAGTLATVLDLTTAGNFASKGTPIKQYKKDAKSLAPTNVEFIFSAGSAAEKTFKAVAYAYRSGGPARRVCTISCTTGTQAVVVFPQGGTATNRFWVDTITVDTKPWLTSVRVPTTQNNNNVCPVSFDILGHEFIRWYIYEADGSTGNEAGDVTVYGSTATGDSRWQNSSETINSSISGNVTVDQSGTVTVAQEGTIDQRLQTTRNIWTTANNCVSAGDEPTALAVDERTFRTIDVARIADSSGDGKITFFDIPASANGLRFTSSGITNDGTYTVNIRAGTLGKTVAEARADGTDSNTTLIGTLAFIIGQQVSTDSDFEMAQSVIVTVGDATIIWKFSGVVDSDRTCEARIDMQGADFIVIIPTTCSANSKLLVKGF